MKEKLVEKIGGRFELILTLTTLFFSLAYGLSIFAGNTENSSQELTLKGSLLIAIYITNYILFEIRGKYIKTRGLEWINALSLIEIGCFIAPLLLIAFSTTPQTNLVLWKFYFWGGLTIISTYGILLIPVAILFLIFFWPKEKLQKRLS